MISSAVGFAISGIYIPCDIETESIKMLFVFVN